MRNEFGYHIFLKAFAETKKEKKINVEIKKYLNYHVLNSSASDDLLKEYNSQLFFFLFLQHCKQKSVGINNLVSKTYFPTKGLFIYTVPYVSYTTQELFLFHTSRPLFYVIYGYFITLFYICTYTFLRL